LVVVDTGSTDRTIEIARARAPGLQRDARRQSAGPARHQSPATLFGESHTRSGYRPVGSGDCLPQAARNADR
jgi:hypothetical protein